ncbi:hypothetical protein DWV12_16405 [Clostridium botulinum]|uniref:hypothetical protein n=1 Tax=Clostridium botulinum TaxID=1491 RepID=UPI0014116AFE|nr:hypothetical protein [Clostridium botulinum]MBY6932056.1 hypothetical protein [Clostridium botulinum]MCS6108898.1 hypothetical protein [Clostridium botulinum]NFG21401.1 hypothetical protein [Clostridium botulinum]NFO82164.1 hypothetical protein [Clostridium botulinum]
MITCIIDKDGYIVNPCIEKKKISEEDICVNVLNDYSLIKPKWNFEKEEWIEGATQEEIQEWEENNKPKPKEPTETEQLQKQLLETQALVAELRYKTIVKENGGM